MHLNMQYTNSAVSLLAMLSLNGCAITQTPAGACEHVFEGKSGQYRWEDNHKAIAYGTQTDRCYSVWNRKSQADAYKDALDNCKKKNVTCNIIAVDHEYVATTKCEDQNQWADLIDTLGVTMSSMSGEPYVSTATRCYD